MSIEPTLVQHRLDDGFDDDFGDEFGDARQRLPFMALLLFVALLFLRPWDHLPALAAMRPMMLMTVATVGLYLLTRPRIEFLSVKPAGLLLALLAVMFLSVLFSYWPSKSLSVATDYMKQIALFVLIFNLTTTSGRLKQLSAVMIVCGAVHGGFAIANHGTGVERRVEGIAGGYFEDPNDLALTLVLVLPIAWWLSSVVRARLARLATYGCMLLLVGGVIATESRGGLLALVATAVVMIWSQHRERRVALLLTLAAAAAFSVVLLPADAFDRYASIATYEKDETAMIRLAVWEAGIRMFGDHPFTGVGAGAFATVYGESYINREVGGNSWRVAHNSYIQVAAELGIFGLLIWVAIVASAFLSLLRSGRLLADDRLGSVENLSESVDTLRKWNAALLASVVGFLVGAIFLSRGYDLLLMIFLALIAVLSRRAEALATNEA